MAEVYYNETPVKVVRSSKQEERPEINKTYEGEVYISPTLQALRLWYQKFTIEHFFYRGSHPYLSEYIRKIAKNFNLVEVKEFLIDFFGESYEENM